ncbi:MAG TPA: hypothetical protein VGL97_03335 [Bryobacteraceae bacterium]
MIRFSTCWKAQNGQCTELHQIMLAPGLDSDTYDFRAVPDRPSQILIGLHYLPDEFTTIRPHRAESPDHYLVTVGVRPVVRRASKEEWSKGTPLAGFAEPADPEHKVLLHFDDNRPFPLGEKLFAKSGPRWPRDGANAGRLSANREYLAIQSWDGNEMDCPYIQPCRSSGGGHYWEDLYDVKSGRRLVAVTGQFWAMLHDTLFTITQWVGNRYFVQPLHQNLQAVLICDMEAAKAELENKDRK